MYKADVWALGVVLAEVAAGQPPWGEDCELYRDYLHFRDEDYLRRRGDNANYFTHFLYFSDEAAELLYKVLDPNPKTRITLEEFRERVCGIQRFLMNEDELKKASSPMARDCYRSQNEKMQRAAKENRAGVPKLDPGSTPSAPETPMPQTPGNSAVRWGMSLLKGKGKPHLPKHMKSRLKAMVLR